MPGMSMLATKWSPEVTPMGAVPPITIAPPMLGEESEIDIDMLAPSGPEELDVKEEELSTTTPFTLVLLELLEEDEEDEEKLALANIVNAAMR